MEEVSLCRDVAASSCSFGLVLAPFLSASEEQFFQSILEQIVDGTEERSGSVPVHQIKEDVVDVAQFIPQERMQFTEEKIVGVTVPQFKEDTVEVTRPAPLARIAAVPVPQIMKEIVDVIQLVPFERMHERVGEHIGSEPVPQIMIGIVAGVQHVPRERVQNRVVEQIGSEPGRVVEHTADVTVPTVKQMSSFVRQTTEESGDGVQHVPSKRMQERHGDSNIKGLDKYNGPRAGVVSHKIQAVENVLAGRVPTGFVRAGDVFRPSLMGAHGTFPSRGRSLKL